MALLDIILKRRSVRKYTGDVIPEEKLEKILQAGLLAPTGKNQKPCEFYTVRDRELLKALSQAKSGGGAMLADCAAAIVAAGDGEKADTWVEDCSIAMSFMHLMAAEQGVGSCWCQIHLRKGADGTDAEAQVRRILSIPEKYRIVGILALGIAEQEPAPHTVEEADWNKVHRL